MLIHGQFEIDEKVHARLLEASSSDELAEILPPCLMAVIAAHVGLMGREQTAALLRAIAGQIEYQPEHAGHA